jgi:hypothetical protein
MILNAFYYKSCPWKLMQFRLPKKGIFAGGINQKISTKDIISDISWRR